MSDKAHESRYVHLTKKIPVVAVRISLADILSIYERVQVALAEQADFEISKLVKGEKQSDEEFEKFKKDAREKAFKVTTTLIGEDQSQVYGEDASVFGASNRPDKVASVYFTNRTAYKAFSGVDPANSFELNLDFSKPPLFDAGNPVSASTPNFSSITVKGNREGWVAAATDAAMGILNARKTRRGWLHRAFVYDLGLLVFAMPVIFFFFFKFSASINRLDALHPVITTAAYVYLFFVGLNLYRALFGYTKWAFPTVELEDNKDNALKHRVFWSAIILALVANVAWEILKLI